jgi:hypothetical protein
MNFEEYLLSLGYVKMVKDRKTMILRPHTNYDILSTMGHLDFYYCKENHEDILYGLYETDKPPIYHWPKPYSLSTESYLGNDEINRIFQTHTNEEIYESMMNSLK